MPSPNGLIAPADPPPTRRARAWPRVGFWAAVVGLAGVNAWRFWDDRPVPETRALVGLVESGRGGEAEPALRTLLRRSPHDAPTRMLLARLLAERGDHRGCAEALRGVPFWSPSKHDALYYEAQSWMEADRARDAEAAYRAYIAEDPNHTSPPGVSRAETVVALVNLLSLEDRWDATREVIWQVLPGAQGGDREELLVMSLRTALERSSPKASVAALRRYVAADGGDYAARLALARASDSLGDRATADAQFDACLALRPADPEVWRALAEARKRRADPAALRAALARAPASAAVVLRPYRAFLLVLDGKLAEAADAYDAALADRPDEPEMCYRAALVARRLGRPESEAKYLRRYRALESATEALPVAFTDYVRDARPAESDPSKRAAALGRLADLCQTLGRDRDAREWARLRDAAAAPTAGPAPTPTPA